MPKYIVTYDLKKKKEFNYENLWAALDSMDSFKYQESCYILSSTLTAKDIISKLKSHIHEDDWLFVAEVPKRPTFSKSKNGTNAWLDKHYP